MSQNSAHTSHGVSRATLPPQPPTVLPSSSRVLQSCSTSPSPGISGPTDQLLSPVRLATSVQPPTGVQLWAASFYLVPAMHARLALCAGVAHQSSEDFNNRHRTEAVRPRSGTRGGLNATGVRMASQQGGLLLTFEHQHRWTPHRQGHRAGTSYAAPLNYQRTTVAWSSLSLKAVAC